MPTIFLSYEHPDRACADQLRQGLAEAGYTLWREPAYPTPHDASYPYMIEHAILGSIAVVVLWSQSAASSPWTKRHILIAQRFFKPLFPVRLDQTSLPSTLLIESLSLQGPCSKVVPHLVAHLPAPDHTDTLLTLGEQASHHSVRVRKAAIDQAATMLQSGQHNVEVLTILEYLARNDLMSGVREKAQAVLRAVTQPTTTTARASASLQDKRHLFGVRCQHGHITTFDRRQVCGQRHEIIRGLDELTLTCATCGVTMAVDVDCEGY